MMIRDRIKELRRVHARELCPNPKNWRTHPEKQKNVLQGVLEEIGYADVLLARELADGTLQLIDGHLRAETTPDQEVPVLVLDLNGEEADKLLAALDPIASLAGSDREKLEALTRDIKTSNESLQVFLGEMLEQSRENIESLIDTTPNLAKEIEIPRLFQIVIECEDEKQQRELFDEMMQRDLKVKTLNLFC